MKRKRKGAMLIEVAVTLPLVMYLVFFAIELIKINLTQVAVDKITEECTFALISQKNVNGFDEIIEKYKPSFIPMERFRYYIRVYTSLDKMMETSPYGGEKIAFVTLNNTPDMKPTEAAISSSFGAGARQDTCPRIEKYGNYDAVGYVDHPTDVEYLTGAKVLPSGYAFVLTIAVHYPFSSPLVEKLFHGGTNTTKPGYYILWARGSGIIN